MVEWWYMKEIKIRLDDIVVFIPLGRKLHRVVLTPKEKKCLTSTISLMHNGEIRVLEEAFDGLQYTKPKKYAK
jgi:hypothetical protein